jgi:hypothetical protein
MRGYDQEVNDSEPGGEAFFAAYANIPFFQTSAAQIENYKKTIIKGAEHDGLVYV